RERGVGLGQRPQNACRPVSEHDVAAGVARHDRLLAGFRERECEPTRQSCGILARGRAAIRIRAEFQHRTVTVGSTPPFADSRTPYTTTPDKRTPRGRAGAACNRPPAAPRSA